MSNTFVGVKDNVIMLSRTFLMATNFKLSEQPELVQRIEHAGLDAGELMKRRAKAVRGDLKRRGELQKAKDMIEISMSTAPCHRGSWEELEHNIGMLETRIQSSDIKTAESVCRDLRSVFLDSDIAGWVAKMETARLYAQQSEDSFQKRNLSHMAAICKEMNAIVPK